MNGKRVFATGGGSGMGLATARGFAEAGGTENLAGRDRDNLSRSGLPHVAADEAAAADETAAAPPVGGALDTNVEMTHATMRSRHLPR